MALLCVFLMVIAVSYTHLDVYKRQTQHDPDVTQEQIHADIRKYVFDAVLPADMVDERTRFFINPTGRFVIGGPHGDSCLLYTSRCV